ncbi:MAG: hypothetical protein WBV06_14275 [Acidimicrobiia bacterium]
MRLDVLNPLAVTAFLALLWFWARAVARTLTPETPPGLATSWTMWVFGLVGSAVALEIVYALWPAQDRPAAGCSGCKKIWWMVILAAVLVGAPLGLSLGSYVIRRRTRTGRQPD